MKKAGAEDQYSSRFLLHNRDDRAVDRMTVRTVPDKHRNFIWR